MGYCYYLTKKIQNIVILSVVDFKFSKKTLTDTYKIILNILIIKGKTHGCCYYLTKKLKLLFKIVETSNKNLIKISCI